MFVFFADCTQIEYFPLSPTLTRIRVHKNFNPTEEIICFPITKIPQAPHVFKTFKRTAPSSTNTKPLVLPPPPKRKSSRNSSTLRLISTMQVQSSRRHETCLTSSCNGVKYLRDKITCKLSTPTVNKKKGETSSKIKVTKMVSAKPTNSKSTITSSLTTTRDLSAIKSKTNLSGAATEKRNTCKTCTAKKNQKRKQENTVTTKLTKSPDLVSPNEVKKAVTKQTVKNKIQPIKSEKKKPLITTKKKTAPNKCAGRAAGNEIVKKLKKMEDEQNTNKIKDEIKKQQQEIAEKNTFFQHLLLGGVTAPPQQKELIKEKTEQLQQKLQSRSEPNIDACRIYLQHIKPVSESKFIQLQKRSVSLPPKLRTKTLTHSHSSSIDSLDKYSYQSYIKELVASNRASNKFKELSRFYNTLERMGQLELKTSVLDEIKPRRKHEDAIIDYERWKELKNKEKTERELQMLYFKLKVDQKERGLLFRPKDIEAFRWKRELDRGLRIKERSVENIKETFERLQEQHSELESAKLMRLKYEKDTYKPLWRGNSVLSLASQMTERRSLSEGRASSRSSLLTRGVGSRIWSSLSLEQVNILRNQLNEIYGQENINRKLEKNTISDESERKQLSQALSTEVLQKQQQQRYKTSVSLVLGKETRGAIAASEAQIKSIQNEIESPRTCYSLELSDDGRSKHKDNEFVLVLTKNDSPKCDIKETLKEWAQPKPPLIKTNAISPPKSETESGSNTDESSKTVINCVDDVQKKVQYFEENAKGKVYIPTVYKAANSDEHLSQSQQDLTEYFGERRSTLLPTKKPKTQNVFRSRSLSPYFGEAYSLIRSGDVRRLKTQFESLNRKNIRRWKSDSYLNRSTTGIVDALKKNYEYPTRSRSRSRRGGVVSPIFFKPEDRLMPHINIISKIANLYARKNSNNNTETRRSNEELATILGCPLGEVEKLRQKFDSLSLLGQLFTSSPSINELRDIAPHLAAEWTAHRYPHFEDNARSLSSPESSSPSRELRLKTRAKSASPVTTRKTPTQPLSILKRDHHHHHQWWTYKPSVKFKGVFFIFINKKTARYS